MDIKHPEGYWVQKLTDEDTRDLLDILVSKRKLKNLKKFLNMKEQTQQSQFNMNQLNFTVI